MHPMARCMQYDAMLMTDFLLIKQVLTLPLCVMTVQQQNIKNKCMYVRR